MYRRKDMLLSVRKDCCWSSYTAKQKYRMFGKNLEQVEWKG